MVSTESVLWIALWVVLWIVLLLCNLVIESSHTHHKALSAACASAICESFSIAPGSSVLKLSPATFSGFSAYSIRFNSHRTGALVRLTGTVALKVSVTSLDPLGGRWPTLGEKVITSAKSPADTLNFSGYAERDLRVMVVEVDALPSAKFIGANRTSSKEREWRGVM